MHIYSSVVEMMGFCPFRGVPRAPREGYPAPEGMGSGTAMEMQGGGGDSRVCEAHALRRWDVRVGLQAAREPRLKLNALCHIMSMLGRTAA